MSALSRCFSDGGTTIALARAPKVPAKIVATSTILAVCQREVKGFAILRLFLQIAGRNEVADVGEPAEQAEDANRNNGKDEAAILSVPVFESFLVGIGN